MRGIELFYQSVARIRQYILSMKGIPCDHIQIGKAYRCFDILYYNIKQNPKDLLVECESIKIEPSSVTLGNSWIPINFAKFNRIAYEEIDLTDAQKAIKQFQFLHATIRSYIDALVKEEPPNSPRWSMSKTSSSLKSSIRMSSDSSRCCVETFSTPMARNV